MREPKKVDFKPRWWTSVPPEDEAAMDAFEVSGSLPAEPPRIDTRILPRDGSCSLSLRSLGEVAELTQKLADYAGHDVVFGPNPDFADLRTLGADLTRLTRLTSEPFEAGSFVIPACLQADPLTVKDRATPRAVRTDDVVQRFGQILTLLEREVAPTEVSIGALQTLEALSRVLNREATGIEFSAATSFREPVVKLEIGERFIGRVREVLTRRRPSQEQLETLEGYITALDLSQGTLHLTVEGLRQRVRGNFSSLLTPPLMWALGQRVRLRGRVEWRGTKPSVIRVDQVELLDVDGLD